MKAKASIGGVYLLVGLLLALTAGALFGDPEDELTVGVLVDPKHPSQCLAVFSGAKEAAERHAKQYHMTVKVSLERFPDSTDADILLEYRETVPESGPPLPAPAVLIRAEADKAAAGRVACSHQQLRECLATAFSFLAGRPGMITPEVRVEDTALLAFLDAAFPSTAFGGSPPCEREAVSMIARSNLPPAEFPGKHAIIVGCNPTLLADLSPSVLLIVPDLTELGALAFMKAVEAPHTKVAEASWDIVDSVSAARERERWAEIFRMK